MSLNQAHSLAHTAQCRLQIEFGRPDRNLRFLVGHLMHYEALRLRIIEIEDDMNHDVHERRSSRFGASHAPSRPRQSSPQISEGVLRVYHDSSNFDDEEEPGQLEVDDETDGLGLTRFPSAATQLHRGPPELEPDDPEDDETDDEADDEDEAISPEHINEDDLEVYLHGPENPQLARMYNGVRNCPCHQQRHDAPFIKRMWDLPDSISDKKSASTQRALAQVT